MQETKQEKRIILTVNGKEKIFYKHELEIILEAYFQNETPTRVFVENRWFKVNPKTIDRELFKEAREDKNQEKTRKLILEAFDCVDKEPEKYGKPFETLIPQESYHDSKVVAGLKERAKKLGDRNADWVEQALEWAQRLCNGETWEALCNDDDATSYYRMVIWKNGNVRQIGGSSVNEFKFPATYVYDEDYYHSDGITNTVPLVVRYIDK